VRVLVGLAGHAIAAQSHVLSARHRLSLVQLVGAMRGEDYLIVALAGVA